MSRVHRRNPQHGRRRADRVRAQQKQTLAFLETTAVFRRTPEMVEEAESTLRKAAEEAPDLSWRALDTLLREVTNTAQMLAQIACKGWDARHRASWETARSELIFGRMWKDLMGLSADDHLTLGLDIP